MNPCLFRTPMIPLTLQDVAMERRKNEWRDRDRSEGNLDADTNKDDVNGAQQEAEVSITCFLSSPSRQARTVCGRPADNYRLFFRQE